MGERLPPLLLLLLRREAVAEGAPSICDWLCDGERDLVFIVEWDVPPNAQSICVRVVELKSDIGRRARMSMK